MNTAIMKKIKLGGGRLVKGATRRQGGGLLKGRFWKIDDPVECADEETGSGLECELVIS
jgi:hypothetical protein